MRDMLHTNFEWSDIFPDSNEPHPFFMEGTITPLYRLVNKQKLINWNNAQH